MYRIEYYLRLICSPFLPLYSGTTPPRRQFYTPVLTKVRYTMISRMAKPEEVLVVENDQGEVVREFMKDTDSINIYKSMRETLVYLTHLDYIDTERIMTEKLQNQVNRMFLPLIIDDYIISIMLITYMIYKLG